MPEDTSPQTDQTQDQSQDETPIDFDTWFESQPQAVKDAFAGHIGGLKSALKSERDKAKKLEDAERARQREAQQKQELDLAAKEEFKTLAEQRQARVTELEGLLSQADSLKEQADRREKLLKKYVEKEASDLPDAVKKLLKGLPVEEQLEWLTENAQALRGEKKQEKGVPGTPGEADRRQVDEAKREKARQDMALRYRSTF